MSDAISDKAPPPRPGPNPDGGRGWGRGRRASTPVFKIFGILILLIVAGLGLAVVEQLVGERWSTARSAAYEIGETYGTGQSIRGPMLYVGYDSRTAGQRAERKAALILPQELTIDVVAETQVRYLGIFSSPVFDAKARIRGRFAVPAKLAPDDQGSPFGRTATFYLSLANLRRVARPEMATLAGAPLRFEAGTPPGSDDMLPVGLVAPVALPSVTAVTDEETIIPFEIEIAVPGSQFLMFAPVGDVTTLTVDADWPHPGFRGVYPPEARELDESSFSATWRIDDLARGYPRIWRDLSADSARELWWQVEQSETGVDFVVPADPYQQATRAIKYGLLVVGATFGALFVFELTAGLRIHPVRYLLVAVALSLFFVLLIAFAEIVGFDLAYLTAAVAVVLQLLLYLRTVLESWGRAILLTAILCGLYLGLYVILGMEEFSLVTGAVFLFFGLSALMWTTRRIDWYAATPQPPGLASPGLASPGLASPGLASVEKA